ncbi:hypothetical protein FRB90_011139 [Tulasnella sp. 427]|nr:hypothetical protein FRB90_011139 [Tulasnella sp. 427]
MPGSFRGRSSLDTNNPDRSAALDTSMSFSSTRKRRDGNTSVLDLSTKFESDELEENPVVAQMRMELRDAQKEIERLTSLAANLQTQLVGRPPLAKVQAMEKEHQQLELLYHSTQRENQLCMSELEKGKRRERILEGELARLVGDNWMESLNLAAQLNPVGTAEPRSSPVTSTRTPLSSTPASAAPGRRPSVVTRGLSTSSHRGSPSVTTLDHGSRPVSPSSLAPSALPQASSDSGQPSLTEHLEQIRSLILGMDQKLKLQDEKLQGMAATAKAEEKKSSTTSLSVEIMQAGSSKGKAKGDSDGQMELLSNETFLDRLRELFEATKSKGTVWLTQKRHSYDPNGEAPVVSGTDEAEYKCLLRATDGHVKFETLISSAELGKFHALYAALLKASMSTLRKRDKKKEKQKAEQAALWKKKLAEEIVIEGAKRGNGRRKRVRRIKAAIRQDEERKAAAKREEQRAKTEN